MEIRSRYGYDKRLATLRSALRCSDLSLTIQSQAEEADINTIVKRFGVTGQLPQVSMPPMFGDFENLDFKTAQLALIEGTKSFMALPAEVRTRFGNDPAYFMDFCEKPENLDELRKMGLAVPKVEPPPVVSNT